MKQELSVVKKLLFRRTSIIAACGAILGFTLGFLVHYLNIMDNDMESMLDYLNRVLRFSFMGVLFFSFLSYEGNSLVSQTDMEESLKAEENALWKLAAAWCLWLLLPLLLWCGLIYGIQSFQAILGGGFSLLYEIHTLKAVMLYCFLPGAAGILLGACLQRWSRPKAYAVLLFTAIVVSPFLLERYAGLQFYWFQLTPVLDWLCLGTPNTLWMSDNVYGISMETSRWVLRLFWCCGLFALLSAKVRPLKGRKGKFALGLALLLTAALGARYSLRGQDYIMDKDMRQGGISSSEFSYYYKPEDPEALVVTETEAFQVEGYELDFKVGDYLKAKAVIQLREKGLGQYGFTLSHYYKVKKVTDGQGNKLEYTRRGNYLDVVTKGADTIAVEYEGSGGKYFANGQGVALPGYFAYYPIPGHKETRNYVEDYGAITDQEETIFQVKVRSPLTLYSNLPQTGENEFSGTAKALTLYGGLLEEIQKDGVRYVDSPFNLYPIHISAQELEEKWNQYQKTFGIEEELSFTGKTIFIQSATIVGLDGGEDSLVVFPDHVLLGTNFPNPVGICANYFMDRIPMKEKHLLWEMLDSYLHFEYGEGDSQWKGKEKPERSQFSLLMKYGSANETQSEEWEAYIMEENRVPELFSWQAQNLGEDFVLRAVYEYLLDDSNTENPVKFLYDLGGE